MVNQEVFALRQEALEALEKSTTMLEVALELIEQGNQAEAKRLRNEAHTQRTISTLLMSEANNIERDRKSIRAKRSETANANIPTPFRRPETRLPITR